MVEKAVQASDELAKQGISARVLNMSSIKQIDEAAINKAASETGAILTCEEHTVKGGLGGAVAEVLCLNKQFHMYMICKNETFGESGKAEDLLKKYNLTSEHIVEEAVKLITRK